MIINDLVQIASDKSSYYRDLYEGYDLTDFDSLPIVDLDSFWKSNTLLDNKLLTTKQNDGIVLKSGGTTGNPKYSFFSQVEWDDFTSVFAKGLDASILEDGDRVANLFYAGEMYASFIFIMRSLEKSKKEAYSLPSCWVNRHSTKYHTY